MIGPNGSGKTRQAVQIAKWNRADMIGAIRNIALQEDLPVHSLERAKANLRNNLQNRQNSFWELWDEINYLFAKLMVEDSASATRFRDGAFAGEVRMPEETKLTRLSAMWGRLFPGRTLSFAGYSPRVSSTLSGAKSEYSARTMSDGERVAVYLAGRVLDSESETIVVDEPEVHFHSLLGVTFWNELEALRHDCRFVYVTHDLPFALSRRDATFAVIRPQGNVEQVLLKDGIPKDLAQALLGAASFSIHASRIVFCEGTEGQSLDPQLYKAWFRGHSTVVIPVGSAKDVIRATVAFGESKLVAGLEAIGIIDRDYWPEEFFASLPSSVHPLPVHEVENVFCLHPVFRAVANHLSLADAETRYQTFVARAKQKVTGGLLAKQISERFRKRAESEFRRVLGSLEVSDDLQALKKHHAESLRPDRWQTPPEEAFEREQKVVEAALSGSSDELLRVLPAKVFLHDAAEQLGVAKDRYVQLVCDALLAHEGSPLSGLSGAIAAALENVLPRREPGSTPA